jgi:hypothetical protein
MQKLTKLYKSDKKVMFLSMLLEAGISYGFASLAIDRGNLWWYLLALIFLVRALKDLFRLIGSYFNSGKQKAA